MAEDRGRENLLLHEFPVSYPRHFHLGACGALIFRKSGPSRNDWRLVRLFLAYDLDGRRLRIDPRRDCSLEGSRSRRQFRTCERRQSPLPHSFHHPLPGRRSPGIVFSDEVYVALLWSFSYCHRNSPWCLPSFDESSHLRRAPADGPGGRVQTLSQLCGRRSLESRHASTTNARSVRKIPALRP